MIAAALRTMIFAHPDILGLSIGFAGMAPETAFAANAGSRVSQNFPEDYAATMNAVLSGFQNYAGLVKHALVEGCGSGE